MNIERHPREVGLRAGGSTSATETCCIAGHQADTSLHMITIRSMATRSAREPSTDVIRFIPRLPSAWSAFFGLFVVLAIIEFAVGELTQRLGSVGTVVFALMAVVMFSFVTAVAVAERPRSILLDRDGFSILGLPAISWSAVESVRLEKRRATYSTFTQLVITLKDPASLRAARAGHGGRFDLGPTRRRAELRQPNVVRVTLPRRLVQRIKTFLEGRPEYADA